MHYEQKPNKFRFPYSLKRYNTSMCKHSYNSTHFNNFVNNQISDFINKFKIENMNTFLVFNKNSTILKRKLKIVSIPLLKCK